MNNSHFLLCLFFILAFAIPSHSYITAIEYNHKNFGCGTTVNTMYHHEDGHEGLTFQRTWSENLGDGSCASNCGHCMLLIMI